MAEIWHAANIVDPADAGSRDVEGWDFGFDGTEAYAATSFGLYQLSQPLSILGREFQALLTPTMRHSTGLTRHFIAWM